mgnify:CR=1 FL=1
MSSIKAVPFPGGACRPDQMEKWIRWKHSEQVARGLNDIAHGRIPEGKFKPLWDKEAIAPLPTAPAKTSFGDKLKIRHHQDEINRRKAENARIIAERNEWWRDGNNEYFTMITDSMIVSAPSMREMLQERYRIDDGVYDGYGAMETYIKAFACKRNFPLSSFWTPYLYNACQKVYLKVEKKSSFYQ